MNKTKHTVTYIIQFFFGLLIMELLLPFGSVIAIVFFVIYLLSVRIRHTHQYDQERDEYNRNNPEDKFLDSGYHPESPEGKAERRSNYRD